MASLAGATGYIVACLAATGLLVLALFAIPLLRRRVLGFPDPPSDSFATLPETRRGLIGLPHQEVAPGPEPAAGEAGDSSLDIAAAAADEREGAPLDADGARHFLSIAKLCGSTDRDLQKTLSELCAMLASAIRPDEPWSCRIELMNTTSWSPGYVAPSREFDVPVIVAGTQVGQIRLGATTGATVTDLDAAARALLDAAAVSVAQMLERRADRQQMETLRAELGQQHIAVRQTAQMALIGAWAFEARTELFKWSEEIRRITAIDSDRAGRERERVIATQLIPAAQRALETRRRLDHELSLQLANGETRILHAIGDVDESKPGSPRVVGIMRDVTEDREALRQLTHIANHDSLTALPNRRYFHEQLDAALLERSAKGALLIIDIDRFKDLNDTGGHDVGDMLLRDFGRRLQEAAGGAFAARLGGDEFAVLLPIADRSQAEHLSRTLIAELTGPLIVFGHSASVQVSAGLAMYPADGRITTELLKNADLALYEAKARGRNMLVVYEKDFRLASEQRARVLAEVREALPQKEFVPYYQPKVHLDTGEITGFEALVRWNRGDDVRTPGQFAPALDDPELSRQLCAAMLDRIIADMARWQAKHLPFGRVAFNASSSEFSGFDLAGHLKWRLTAIGVTPSRLGVEVTEAVLLDGAADSIRSTLTELRQAGIETALDDFGTGYASLTHLRDLPVDVIKIDQSFVRRLLEDSDSRAITTAVVALGRGLGKIVVAEGVETSEQAWLLKAAGCDQVQGYLFGRPMPAENVPKFIANWRGAEQISALEANAA